MQETVPNLEKYRTCKLVLLGSRYLGTIQTWCLTDLMELEKLKNTDISLLLSPPGLGPLLAFAH